MKRDIKFCLLCCGAETRLFTISLFMHVKEKASKARAKHIGVGCQGFASKASKKKREALDPFGEK